MSKTKQDLIERISSEAELSKTKADEIVTIVTSYIEELLSKKDKLTLVGFGSFETADRAARTGRNPQTGAEMQIPSAVVPKFKPGKKLKDAVNR